MNLQIGEEKFKFKLTSLQIKRKLCFNNIFLLFVYKIKQEKVLITAAPIMPFTGAFLISVDTCN